MVKSYKGIRYNVSDKKMKRTYHKAARRRNKIF